jgi:hypothetical protein
MISGEWITGLVVAVIGAVGSAMVAYKKGAASRMTTSITDPVPEVPTRKVSTPPSWDAHRALCDRVSRVEETTQELRRDLAGQYRELMQAGAAREQSLSDKLDGIARGIHHRIDELMLPKTNRHS